MSAPDPEAGHSEGPDEAPSPTVSVVTAMPTATSLITSTAHAATAKATTTARVDTTAAGAGVIAAVRAVAMAATGRVGDARAREGHCWRFSRSRS